MSVDLFKRIVEKAKLEGYESIGINNWTEPFLAKTLPECISVVREFGLYCDISSNLSLNPLKYFDAIHRSLLAGIHRLTVSVSGYNQAVYEINHAGGNISWVKENLERISRLRRDGIVSARVFIKLIKFDYNIREEPVLKEYANSLNLDFEVIDGVCHPNNPVSSNASEEYILNRIDNTASSATYEKNGEICPLIMDTVSIDCEGDVYVCCAYGNYPSLRIGPYLEIAGDDILLKRYTHPICISCTFPRRKATESDCRTLAVAMKSRGGNPNDLAVITPNKFQDEYTQYVESLLREKEMILNSIYESRGWKALVRYYKLRDKILRRNHKV